MKGHGDILSFNINNDLLSTHSITVLGPGYTALNQKDTEITIGGGRDSVTNQKPKEYKVKSCDMCLGGEKDGATNEQNRRPYLDWVVKKSLRP